MGADYSQLRVSALAAVSDIEKDVIMNLRWNIKNLLPEDHKGNDMSKDILKEALAMTELPESDVQMVLALFDMHDGDSDGIIDYRDLLVGLSVFVTGGVNTKLKAAFAVYDEQVTSKAGFLILGEVRKVLNAINQTAMFFGDPGLSDIHLREIVIDTFKKASTVSSPMKYLEIIPDLENHQRCIMFLEARGYESFSYKS